MNAQVALALDLTGGFAPISHTYQSGTPRSFEVIFDQACHSVWQTRVAMATSSVDLAQLREARNIDEKIHAGAFRNLRFKVLSSAQPGIFSLGGDLDFFCRCIESQDHNALYEYALLAAKAIWANAAGFGSRQIQSIAIAQGEAQGGGFEAALSCNTLIAERGTFFGFPESLFGMFPGMGGALLLETRVDADVAARIVNGAGRYTAEFLHEIGVVDYLVPHDQGRRFAEALMVEVLQDPNCPRARLMEDRQNSLANIKYESLLDSIDRWTDQAMNLNARHIRSMKYIVEVQNRRAA